MMRAATCGGRRIEWLALASAVAVLLAVRLPFLPPTLEDIDSVNFDNGVHQYDPVHHQPHPPGFPVYIFLARLAHPWFDTHAAGLAFVSALFGALAVVPLYLLFRSLTSRAEAALACTLTLFNPVVWFNSVRPMSDVTGFFMVTTAQWLLVSSFDRQAPAAKRPTRWLLGTMLAGLSVGTRLQALWLVGPALLLGLVRMRSIRLGAVTLLCFAGAVAVWLVPLLALSGGPSRFLDSFASMVTYSLPVEPLVMAPSLRRAAAAASDVFLSPWQTGIGVVVALLAAAGAVILARSERRVLAMLALLFVPYTAYHYTVQATPNLRYAIPIVPLLACLASVTIVRGGRHAAVLAPAAAAAAATVAAVVTVPALIAYGSTPSPPFQALSALEQLHAPAASIVVTGHYVFERYLGQIQGHEVLVPTEGARRTLMAYWRQGGQKPVLFFREPTRTTLLLFGHDRQEVVGRWIWPAVVEPFMQGERPGRVELLRLEPPRWFAEGGFFVTDEAGPIDVVVRERAQLRVRASPRRRALVLSGYLYGARTADVALKLGGEQLSTWTVGERFVLQTLLEPMAQAQGYVPLSFEASAPAVFTDVWLEPADHPFIRPSHGFYLAERDEDTELFRWTAPDAVANAYLPVPKGRVTIQGWIPTSYLHLPLRVSLDWNGRPAASFDVTTPRFRITQDVIGSPDAPWGKLGIRASQSFVPHERQRNGDRRTLSIRIYRLTLEGAG